MRTPKKKHDALALVLSTERSRKEAQADEQEDRHLMTTSGDRLDATILAGQLTTLAATLVGMTAELSPKDKPTKSLVRDVQNLADILLERAELFMVKVRQ